MLEAYVGYRAAAGLTSTPTDASSIPVPTDLPGLPTGTFNLPMKDPSRVESSCLTDSDQNSAGVWKCASDTNLQLTVRQQDSRDTSVSFVSYRDKNSKILYGAVPPDVITESPVSLLRDNNAPEYGPAFFFQSSYNKTVIVPEGNLNTSITWRSADGISGGTYRLYPRDTTPKPGERPWFCYWEQTIFEGFIYVQRDANDRKSVKESSSSLPKLIKIEERRINGSPQPYCKQKQIMNDGSAVDAENSPIIKLQEKSVMPKQMVDSTTKQKRAGDDQCHCEWTET